MSSVNDIIAVAESMPPSKPLGTTPEIEAYEDEQDASVRGLAWRVTDLSSADWALRRLAECEAEAAEIDRQAEAAIAQIEARRAALKARAENGAGYFRFQLIRFAGEKRGELLKGSKKSRDLIHGRIQFRASPERLKVTDPVALEGWLLTQPPEAGLYRMKIAPEMRALNERFKAEGEIPPGCDVEPSRESITIEAQAPEAGLMVKR
jgi:phage host-nuclease inhibitor protein Gam